MKKFLLSIFAVMLAVVGVQAEEVSGTITFKTSGSDSNTAATADNFVSGQVVNNGGFALSCKETSKCYTGVSGLKMGSSSGTGDFILNLGDTYNVKRIIVNAVRYGDKDNAQVSVNGATGQILTASLADYIFDINADISQIKVAMVKRGYVASITIVYEVSGEGGGETPDPTPVAPATPTLTASCNFDNSMNVEITNVAAGATAYYSLNNETNWVAGTSVTITETTTVYAKVVKDDISSDVVFAIYTKNEPAGGEVVGGEVVDVLNRELTGISGTTYTSWSGKTSNSSAVYAGQSAGGNDAIQLRSSNSNSGIITTKSGGKVRKISIVWNDATGSRTLNIYGKNSPYTSPEDLYKTDKQGDLLGQITKAAGRATDIEVDGDYEYIGLRSNSSAMYINEISITWEASADVTPVAPAVPVLTEAQTFKGSMFVTITSDATVYYTTDGTTPSATNGTEYTVPFEITATTTIKAVAVNEVGESEVVEATYTLFVVEETEGYYVKVTSEPADWTGKYLVVYEDGANAYVFNGKDQANGYVAATIDGAVIKANNELDAVAVTIATMEGGYSIMTADGYISGIASANKLNFSTTEQLNTIAMGIDGVDINAGRYLRFNSAAGDMRFRYYNMTYGESVQLYKYVTELPSYTLTVGKTGWATMLLDFNVAIPDGVQVWTVEEIVDGYAVLGEVSDVIPAGCPVLVKAVLADDYEFTYTSEAGKEYANLLKGTTKNEYITEEAYVLWNVDGEACFCKADMNQLDGTAWLNNANKAYLPASAVPNKTVAFYGFDWEGTTGISEVKGENGEVKAIFDLTGRRVEAITAPGIYVVNGRKVLVK